MLSEYIFVASGAVGVTIFIQWLVLPLAYGSPLIIYWTLRRYLQWRTLFIYSYQPALKLCAVVIVASLLFYYFPTPVAALATNFWFASGVALGTVLWLGRIAAFKSVRSDIHNQLTDDIKMYVTPKGRLPILALLCRW